MLFPFGDMLRLRATNYAIAPVDVAVHSWSDLNHAVSLRRHAKIARYQLRHSPC